MKTFLTPLQYNEIFSASTDIVINGSVNEEVSRLRTIVQNMKSVVAINQKENDEMMTLLNLVITDDGSRYNRPGYYYKIMKYLKEKESV